MRETLIQGESMFLRRKSSGKAGVRVSLVSGAALAAIGLSAIGAGSASAAPKCTGANITGAGSSLQKIAQTEVWKPGFEGTICNSGTHPTITYNSIGSGAGIAEWNATAVKGSIDTGLSFIGTDDAPTAAQIANIKSVAGGSQVAVIPVAQTAISIVANPPAGCELEGISNGDLTAVMEGRLSNWSKVEGAEGECNSAITRVVRKDASGTSFQFKNYLFALYKKGLFCTTGGTEGKQSWQEMEPVGTTGTPNTSWPESCPEKTLSTVIRPAGTGGGEEVKAVNATAGSIGYAALPDAEANVKGTTVILNMQNNGQKKGGEANYAPAASGNTANCGGVTYTVPKLNGGLDIDWSGVFGAKPSIGGENYPLCTLTYDLAFSDYSSAGFSEGQEISARDYLNEYIVQNTGQSAINSNFYSAIPTSGEDKTDVLGAARRAAKTIAF
jgi:ABC-type phosphate transport system substrate-binding protein